MRFSLRSFAIFVAICLVGSGTPAVATPNGQPTGVAVAHTAHRQPVNEPAHVWTAIAGVFATIGEPTWSALARGAAIASDPAAIATRSESDPQSTATPKTKEPLKAKKKAGAARTVEEIFGPFNTLGLQPKTAALPYMDRPPVDVHTARIDDQGIAIYEDRASGVRMDHPVVYAQYGLSALVEYDRTGNLTWLERAQVNADQLIRIKVERSGAWWFPYMFDWTYYQRTVTAPWWSGMAQGEALSLFTRLSQVDPDPKWRAAADATFTSFLQHRVAGQPWASIVVDNNLWFEEFAGNQPPLMVLNGHAFATFGIYDYAMATGKEQAIQLFDAAATTVLDNMNRFEVPGGVSYYCAQAGYCQSPAWQNQTYHPIHIWQLRTLARITGDTRFEDWAQRLEADWQATPAPPAAP